MLMVIQIDQKGDVGAIPDSGEIYRQMAEVPVVQGG